MNYIIYDDYEKDYITYYNINYRIILYVFY